MPDSHIAIQGISKADQKDRILKIESVQCSVSRQHAGSLLEMSLITDGRLDSWDVGFVLT